MDCQDEFYTCDHCHRVLVDDRYSLVGSHDFDLCAYDYAQLSPADQYRFEYVRNEHMGGVPSSVLGGGGSKDDEVLASESAKATPEEDHAEALFGMASDDEFSDDDSDMSSIDSFIDDNIVFEEDITQAAPIGPIETLDFDDFITQEPFPPMQASPM